MRKKQKKIKVIRNLVLGSEGFLGKTLCTFLEKKGEVVERFDIKRGDREDCRVAILPLEKIDRVYFLAWEVGGAKYLYRKDTQLQQLNWNLELLRNVMFQLQKRKTTFVFISSQLANESDTAYGALKKVGEVWTEQLKGVCVRLWNIYGTNESLDERSHVISDFVHQAVTTGKIKMMTTGEEMRQFIHVEDACEALHMLMERNLHSQVYDVTNFEWISIKDVANLIARVTGAKVIPGTKKGSDTRQAIIKGKPPVWKPQISIEEGLRRMISAASLKRTRPKK